MRLPAYLPTVLPSCDDMADRETNKSTDKQTCLPKTADNRALRDGRFHLSHRKDRRRRRFRCVFCPQGTWIREEVLRYLISTLGWD